jgi:hypothetical protein
MKHLEHFELLKRVAEDFDLLPGELGRVVELLEEVLDPENWHEGDALPNVGSFRNLLRWMVDTDNPCDLHSLGVSHEGNILAVWTFPDLVVTANFGAGGAVIWRYGT